jgi:chorismate mutase
MSDSTPSLSQLRSEIDRIDDSIHDLIRRRALVVEEIRRAKGRDNIFLRPGREAAILRRLMNRHDGGFPLPSLVRMWRELMSGFLNLQQDIQVVACGGGAERLAHDHFGVVSTMTSAHDPRAALTAIDRAPGTVAVLAEDAGGASPWWLLLGHAPFAHLRVIARLPFFAPSWVSALAAPSYVVAGYDADASGHDHTLFVLSTLTPLDAAEAMAGLAGAGVAASALAQASAADGRWCGLFSAPGLSESDDPAWARRAGQLPWPQASVKVIGAYATPAAAPSV